MKRLRAVLTVARWASVGALVMLLGALEVPASRSWLLGPIVTVLKFDPKTSYSINRNGTLAIDGALSEPGIVTLLVDGIPFGATSTTEETLPNGGGRRHHFFFDAVVVGDASDRIALAAVARVGWASLRARTAGFTAQVDTLPLLDVTAATSANQVAFRGIAAATRRLRITAFPTDFSQSSTTASTVVVSDIDGRFQGVVSLPVPGAYLVTASEVANPTRTSASVTVTRLVAASADALKTVSVLAPYQRRIDCNISLDEARVILRFELPATDARLDAFRRGDLNFGELVSLVYGVMRLNELTMSELFSRTTPVVSVAGGRAVVTAESPEGVYSDSAYPGYFRGAVQFRQDFASVGVSRYAPVVEDVLTIHPHGLKISAVSGDQSYDVSNGSYTWRGVDDGRTTRYIRLATSSRPWEGWYELKQFLTSSLADLRDPSTRARPALVDETLRGLLLCVPAVWMLVLMGRRSKVRSTAATPAEQSGPTRTAILDDATEVRISAGYAIALGVSGPILLGISAIGALWSRHDVMMQATHLAIALAAVVAVLVVLLAYRRGVLSTASRISLWVACLVGLTAAIGSWVDSWPGDSSARQAVIDLMVLLPTSTALIFFTSFTVTLASGGRVPRLPFAPAVLMGALLAIPLPFLSDSIVLDVSGWPESHNALEVGWQNALWIVRPLFAICGIMWLKRVGNLPAKTRFDLATLLFASYVGGSTRLLVGLPLYIIIAAAIFRKFLVDRTKLEMSPAVVDDAGNGTGERAHEVAISRAISDAKHRHLDETRAMLWDDLLRGGINAKEYRERKVALDKILEGIPHPERRDEDAHAIGEGPGSTDFENGAIAARWSTVFILPFLWFSLKAFGFDVRYARPYPVLASVSDVCNSVLDVVLPAFIFGYAFRLIRGETGLSKGVWTFVAVVLSVGGSWLLNLSSPIAIGVTIILTFFYYVGIGGAFDLILVKKARGHAFRLLDLGFAQGWTPMVSRMAPFLAFFAILATSVGGIFAKELIPEVAKVLTPGVTATSSASGTSSMAAPTVGVTPSQ